MWISPKFAVRVSQWVREWRQFNDRNEEEFQFQLATLEPGEGNATRERQIRDSLREELCAECEVETPVGFIDLLTDTKLIEIKVAADWKHAIGQLLCYSVFYPDHEMWLYSFDSTDDELIDQICSKYRIQVRRLSPDIGK
jgi:hypothetical protein